ncbi:MAG: P-loop ATPase, Sll1717 family [Terriglobales bacterium]
MKHNKGHKPFGQAACESELQVLKSDYPDLYFSETPFNEASLDQSTYLIIGRRGAGKTALAQYFSFQEVMANPIYINIDKPTTYHQVLSDVSARASDEREIAIPRLEKVWEYVLWRVIFTHALTDTETSSAEEVPAQPPPDGRASGLVNSLIDAVAEFLRQDGHQNGHIGKKIDRLVKDSVSDVQKMRVLEIAKSRPIIIAFDTLEKYDIANDPLINAIAALVQFAARFNVNYAVHGIHLKVFMSGEVFSYLEEEVLQNPSKSVSDPVYLLWRPKDLLRLIGWRFYHYLKVNNLLHNQSKGDVDWTNHREVHERLWVPYFGKEITNARGFREGTFSYVLRHTQMRPRQLILLCNSIAECSMHDGSFPVHSERAIREGVKRQERELAAEIINSFSARYPQVRTIVDSLMGIPMVFRGNELDRRASQSASEWPRGTYSQGAFRRLVAEVGIIGRTRKHEPDSGYIEADFQYSLRERLPLTHSDECAVHPMFYSRFNVDCDLPSRVIPKFSAALQSSDGDFDLA